MYLTGVLTRECALPDVVECGELLFEIVLAEHEPVIVDVHRNLILINNMEDLFS